MSARGESADLDQPTGSGDYVVKQGDCIASIAEDHGFLWETIWFDPKNETLRSVRHDPNALLPGDRLTISAKEAVNEACATENKHSFRLKNTPAKLRLRLLDLGQPRARCRCTLLIDGQAMSGETDADGYLEIAIKPDSKNGMLRLHTNEGEEEYPLQLGGVDPVDTISGAQQRLYNLGFDCGAFDGVCGWRTEAAIRTFQANQELEVTGRLDEETVSKLKETHGG